MDSDFEVSVIVFLHFEHIPDASFELVNPLFFGLQAFFTFCTGVCQKHRFILRFLDHFLFEYLKILSVYKILGALVTGEDFPDFVFGFD